METLGIIFMLHIIHITKIAHIQYITNITYINFNRYINKPYILLNINILEMQFFYINLLKVIMSSSVWKDK